MGKKGEMAEEMLAYAETRGRRTAQYRYGVETCVRKAMMGFALRSPL